MRFSSESRLGTGADASIIPSGLCKDIALRQSAKTLLGPGDANIPVIGCFDAKLSVNNTEYLKCVYVVYRIYVVYTSMC